MNYVYGRMYICIPGAKLQSNAEFLQIAQKSLIVSQNVYSILYLFFIF